MKYLKKIKPVHILIIIFFFTNLFFLTEFPYVHSDEAWLSGLSRNILIKRNLSITEPFFDLYPRNPHAIKLLFHLLQAGFIKILGYNIFTFRFISLLAGTIALYYFYKIAKKITNSNYLSGLAVILLSLDIQFIYSSHFARQEIILVLILLIALYLLLYRQSYKKTIYMDLIIASILGTAIGIHPNSFIIALPFILIYSYNLLISKKIRSKNYIAFASTIGLIALFFVILSYRFDSNFINNYSKYGQTLGVSSPTLVKIQGLYNFYKKLFYQVSGTYYTPDTKFQFILFAIILIYTGLRILYSWLNSLLQIKYNLNRFKSSKKIHKSSPEKDNHFLSDKISQIKKKSPLKIKINEINILLFLCFVGINLGYIIIGRYNQTSIIFIFPICYLLILNIGSSLRKKYRYILMAFIIVVLAINTTITIINECHYNYDKYLEEIARVVNKDDQVLANLNLEYYFNNDKLLDYRNLNYLEENEMTFLEYITANEIKYIIYPEEMDFIYNTRPVWNDLYGNLYPYYQQMQNYLNNNCELIHSFTSNYGMRITRYINEKDWEIKIYKIDRGLDIQR